MNKVQNKLTAIEAEVVHAAGDLAASISLARSVGQIYGLLFISPDPLALDDLCLRLSLSKGNVSINLRILEDWGAVEKVGGVREPESDTEGRLVYRITASAFPR